MFKKLKIKKYAVAINSLVIEDHKQTLGLYYVEAISHDEAVGAAMERNARFGEAAMTWEVLELVS